MPPDSKLFSPFARPSPPPEGLEQVSSNDSTNVLSRLHALFGSPITISPTDVGHRDASTVDIPAETSKTTTAAVVSSEKDRNAIKVLVVTWNMGDALPKGDLSVLFGDIPDYVDQPKSTEFSQLSVENAHPYHIVVVAGQECPTDSRVPRGLGGGIMKGVHVRAAHRKGKKDDKDKERVGDGEEEGGLRSPLLLLGVDSSEEDEYEGRHRVTSPSSTTPQTPGIYKSGHSGGSKGWSTMLDEWFCGPSNREQDHPSTFAMTPSLRETPFTPQPYAPSSPGPLSPPRSPIAPRTTSDPARSSDAPHYASNLSIPSEPVYIPRSPHDPPHEVLSQSPLARSQSSQSSGSSSSASYLPFFTLPPANQPKHTTEPIQSKIDRPEIVIPREEPSRTAVGDKCYIHLVKERLMGMYLSVYVYKGCEHLIRGVDKDFVTAGLAGGRVGNKGGIGISLKLGDHRFLFVNSHLAAHTARVQARLNNIAKIKSELRLDCFLPKDDPRAAAPDLTDRFDTTFWCGDLNFRLDLSRLHAEWLVEHKKYDEALMWDQLQNAMKDRERDPFPGFEEALINFAPTFKYDVWRSIKTTNRDLRRSLRRRVTLDGRRARRPQNTEGQFTGEPQGAHAGVQNAVISEEQLEKAAREDGNETDATQGNGDYSVLDPDRHSYESNGYTSAGHSTVCTDIEDEGEDLRPYSVDASAYGSRHKAFEAALKSKTKHLLSIVKMDRILSSPSKGRIRRVSAKVKEKHSTDLDASSRRTSMSSFRSMAEEANQDQEARADTIVSPSVIGDRRPGLNRHPSEASICTSSPPRRPSTRKFSILKRTTSGRSVHTEASSREYAESFAYFDKRADHREGTYDSSKKQRVPSWCDRVLWKSHVIPDPEAAPKAQDLAVPTTSRQNKPFNRLSQAFVTFGGHLKLPPTRTGSIDTASIDQVLIDRNPAPTPPYEHISIPALVASPDPSLSMRTLVERERQGGFIPAPKGPSPRPSTIGSNTSSRFRSLSHTPHPLTDVSSVVLSPPAHPKITFDPALPAEGDRSHVSNVSLTRPRANSENLHETLNGKEKVSTSGSYPDRTSSGDQNHFGRPPRSNSTEGPRQSSGGSLRLRQRTRTLEPVSPATELTVPHPDLSHLPRVAPQDDKSAFVRFLRDLPGWLHGRGSMHSHDEPDDPRDKVVDETRTRHLQGEVICMHYGTIDDLGMRQLEGRSDHRPAIFAAAVYV